VATFASGVTAIAAGYSHSCARTSTGSAKCWGYNAAGQLGDNTTTTRLSPVLVRGRLTNAVALAAGGAHNCARTAASGIKCWGWNYSGQLGDGTTTDRYIPVSVATFASGVTAIAAGNRHTCALTNVGDAKCWGWNYSGQLGDGSTTDRYAPVNVVGF
jgi:alpha-tubulin suppressor-like RCC1 family protein